MSQRRELKEDIYIKRIAGQGVFNFILIHNAGGCHRMFTYQIDTLLRYGDVILFDLPGHGESKPIKDNGIQHSSKLIARISQFYSLDNIWLIGLNNGANIALNTLQNNLIEISGMILIDPPLFMDKEFVSEIKTFILKLKDDAYEDFIHSMVTELLEDSSQEKRDIAYKAFMSVDRNALKEMFLSLLAWDKDSKRILAATKTPSLCILTNEHHCTFEAIKKVAPNFTLGKVIGSKCWATLEVPKQVNAMIERYLSLQKASASQ